MSATPSTNEWFIWVPCVPNMDETRFKIRPQHIKSAMALKESRVMCWGGGILEKQTAPGDTSGMTVTVMTIYADTTEEALRLVGEDVYAKNGIWDMEKAEIFPMKTTIREPL